MTEDRVLRTTGINNFRDYGGYAVAGGGRLKRRTLWRSGQHVGASDDDLALIAPLSITTVIDLRGDSERALNPCRRHDGFAAEVLTCGGETAGLASHFDAGANVVSLTDARAAMCQLYAGMPYRPNLITLLRGYLAALGTRDGASLIHCFAGKDRTGFAVAVAHSLLGVHPDDAMQDYLLTNSALLGRHFPGNSGKEQEKYASMTAEAREALGGVREEFLDAAFAALRDSHGSVNAYAETVLGVDGALRDQIKQRLIEA